MLRRTLAPLALLGLLTVSLPACAQSPDPAPEARTARGPGGDPAERIERRLAAMDEALDLTSRQEDGIRALLEEEAATRPARGARGQGNRQAMREQMRARRAELNAQIEALLTADQVELYRTWLTEQREDRPRRGRRGNG